MYILFILSISTARLERAGMSRLESSAAMLLARRGYTAHRHGDPSLEIL